MIPDPNFGQPESARTHDVCLIDSVDQTGARGHLAYRPAWSVEIPRSTFNGFDLSVGDCVVFEIDAPKVYSIVAVTKQRHRRAKLVLRVEKAS
jgi:hypothetical protein